MNAHLEKMHAAKRAAEAAKREQYRKDAIAYREWLKRESLAFSRRIAISRELTRSSDEFRQADRCWHQLLAAMPAPPPDHADWSIT